MRRRYTVLGLYRAVEPNPVTFVIVYNGLLHAMFRAYAKRKYDILNYHEFKRFFIEKGMEGFGAGCVHGSLPLTRINPHTLNMRYFSLVMKLI